MDLQDVGTVIGLIAAAVGEIRRRREKRAKQDAERRARQAEKTASDLQRILDEAHRLDRG